MVLEIEGREHYVTLCCASSVQYITVTTLLAQKRSENVRWELS